MEHDLKQNLKISHPVGEDDTFYAKEVTNGSSDSC